MMHANSESDDTSLGTSSSPDSPKRLSYYIVTSSHDSHDDADNKSSSTVNQATPVYSTSPMESPSHPSQSRPSSASRVSGPFRKGRKKNLYRHRGWPPPPHFGIIDEEDGDANNFYRNQQQFIRRLRIMLAFMAFVMVFTVACLITWGASRPFKFHVEMQSWRMNNFYYGEGSDYTGVPTKLLTVNCTVKMSINNPATFFGIHVSSSSFNLFFAKIIVGSGQLTNYYQPKRSQRIVTVNLEGHRVPLYGAGAGLVMSENNGSVPLRLEFEIRSKAYLVGKLVKTNRRHQVLCILDIDSENSSNVNKFKQGSCTYS